MSNFNLKQFLKTYKPRNIESVTNKYLESKKLKGYSLYKKGIELIQCKTYIMFVKISDASNSTSLNNIIPGGILLAGGISLQGYFKNNSNYETWTHLLLKYDKNDNASHIYQINIDKYYIFYKIFEDDNDTKKKLFIELLKL